MYPNRYCLNECGHGSYIIFQNPCASSYPRSFVCLAHTGVTQQIEKAGGSVKAVWFNRVTLRAHLFPDKFAILPKSSGLPPPKKHHRYVPHLKESGLLPEDWEQEKWDHSRHIKQK